MNLYYAQRIYMTYPTLYIKPLEEIKFDSDYHNSYLGVPSTYNSGQKMWVMSDRLSEQQCEKNSKSCILSTGPIDKGTRPPYEYKWGYLHLYNISKYT